MHRDLLHITGPLYRLRWYLPAGVRRAYLVDPDEPLRWLRLWGGYYLDIGIARLLFSREPAPTISAMRIDYAEPCWPQQTKLFRRVI